MGSRIYPTVSISPPPPEFAKQGTYSGKKMLGKTACDRQQQRTRREAEEKRKSSSCQPFPGGGMCLWAGLVLFLPFLSQQKLFILGPSSCGWYHHSITHTQPSHPSCLGSILLAAFDILLILTLALKGWGGNCSSAPIVPLFRGRVYNSQHCRSSESKAALGYYTHPHKREAN